MSQRMASADSTGNIYYESIRRNPLALTPAYMDVILSRRQKINKFKKYF